MSGMHINLTATGDPKKRKTHKHFQQSEVKVTQALFYVKSREDSKEIN